MPRVTFRNDENKQIEVPAGTTILQAAARCGAWVGSACGGVCACSTCHVWVVKGKDSLPDMTEQEQDILDRAFDVRDESRLGCQCKLEGDVEVVITEESWDTYENEHPQEEHRPYRPPEGR